VDPQMLDAAEGMGVFNFQLTQFFASQSVIWKSGHRARSRSPLRVFSGGRFIS
jgi:hypothetical protein